MLVKMDTDSVMEKMKELCSSLLEQQAFRELRLSIDRFAEDEPSVRQYERFMEKHRTLQDKEDRNEELSPSEIEEYEREENALYENAVVRKFLYAQREFGHLHHLVTQYLTKTFELNRLPEPGEIKKGGCGCGGNCGCGSGH